MKKLILILVFLLINVANAATTINIFMGAWASGTSYSAGNVVTYSNATYLSLINSNKGKVPSASTSATSWQLIGLDAAPAGPAGPQGPTGAPGATGPAGPAGPQGPAYVAKAGDACTLKNSNIINTGVLTAYNLTAAPVTGKTSFLVCQDPNVWDFVQDAEVSIGTSPQFRNWSLMGAPSASWGGYNPATFVPFTAIINGIDSATLMGPTPALITTPIWSFGVTATQGVGIGGSEVPRSYLQFTPSEEKVGVVFSSNSGATVVRWTSPFTGTVKLEANLQFAATNYYAFYHNSTLLLDYPQIASGNPVTLPFTISVTTGDVIYYVQDWPGTGYLKMKITRLN